MRINFPDNFAAQLALLTSISDKHTADGPDSAPAPYFGEHKIVIADELAAGQQAAIHEKARSLYAKSAENYKQLRDNSFDPVFGRFRGGVQFLKSFYRGNEKALGEWGVTVDGKARISYPADFDAQAALFNTFYDQHMALSKGAGSPLTPYLDKHNIDMDKEKAAVEAAVSHQKAMSDAAKAAGDEKAQRDNLWDPVAGRMRQYINHLKTLHSDNAKALGAYGITVDEAPRAPKLRNTSLKIGEQITISNATIGGTLTNTGTGDLHLYKGKTTTGTPIIIHPGEQHGIVKGWSRITIVNPAPLTAGKFSVLASNT